jgi:hypothetical protein
MTTTPKRKGSLLSGIKADVDQVTAEAATPAPAAAAGRYSRDRADMTTTAVYVPRDALALLRLVAVRRANARGEGRPSVSDVITDLVERHRDELEAEAKG